MPDMQLWSDMLHVILYHKFLSSVQLLFPTFNVLNIILFLTQRLLWLNISLCVPQMKESNDRIEWTIPLDKAGFDRTTHNDKQWILDQYTSSKHQHYNSESI